MFETKRHDVGIVNQIACDSRLLHDLEENGGVTRGFGQQHQGWRSEDTENVLQCDRRLNRGMEDSWVSNNPQEFIHTGPGNRPGDLALSQTGKQLPRGAVMAAGGDFRVHQHIGINCEHALSPIHKIEKRVAIQKVDTGLLVRLPSLQLKPKPLAWRTRQSLPEKIVGDCL